MRKLQTRFVADISKYTENFFLGMSARQTIFGIAGVAIVALGAFILPIPSYVAILLGFPVLLLGFYKPEGLPLEKYLKFWIESKLQNPQIRYFQSDNTVYEYLWHGRINGRQVFDPKQVTSDKPVTRKAGKKSSPVPEEETAVQIPQEEPAAAEEREGKIRSARPSEPRRQNAKRKPGTPVKPKARKARKAAGSLITRDGDTADLSALNKPAETGSDAPKSFMDTALSWPAKAETTEESIPLAKDSSGGGDGSSVPGASVLSFGAPEITSQAPPAPAYQEMDVVYETPLLSSEGLTDETTEADLEALARVASFRAPQSEEIRTLSFGSPAQTPPAAESEDEAADDADSFIVPVAAEQSEPISAVKEPEEPESEADAPQSGSGSGTPEAEPETEAEAGAEETQGAHPAQAEAEEAEIILSDAEETEDAASAAEDAESSPAAEKRRRSIRTTPTIRRNVPARPGTENGMHLPAMEAVSFDALHIPQTREMAADREVRMPAVMPASALAFWFPTLRSADHGSERFPVRVDLEPALMRLPVLTDEEVMMK